MIVAIIGLALGLLVGMNLPIEITGGYSLYISVGILAGFDSVIGAIRANIEGKYDSAIFMSGFLVNSLLAGLLAYAGDFVGIPLYYGAVFAFGMRLFNNFALIRREMLIKIRLKKQK